jgi:fatty acid desaturase
MLRHSEDQRTLYFLVATSAIYTSLINIEIQQINFAEYWFYFFLGAMGAITCCLINHNHRHHPIFTNQLGNRLTNIWISILIGAPSTRLHLVHQYNHHKFYPKHEDWSHFENCANGHGLKRIFTYLKNAIINMNLHRNELVDSDLKKRMILEERLSLFAFIIFCLWFNWIGFLIFILPIWLVGQVILLTSNLLNHDYCPQDESVNNSRDFISGIENWMFCNNGYHSAHHLNPTLHWSQLAELHRNAVVPKKNKDYIEDSFFKFLLSYILLNSSILKTEEEYLKRQSQRQN